MKLTILLMLVGGVAWGAVYTQQEYKIANESLESCRKSVPDDSYDCGTVRQRLYQNRHSIGFVDSQYNEFYRLMQYARDMPPVNMEKKEPTCEWDWLIIAKKDPFNVLSEHKKVELGFCSDGIVRWREGK